MKINLMILMLLIDFVMVAQPEKDSILASDHVKVVEQLKLMHYLDNSILIDYSIAKKKSSYSSISQYFSEVVIKNNPCPSVNLYTYIGYTANDIPEDENEFIQKIASKNASDLLKIISIYGFPSFKRLEKFLGNDKLPGSGVFISREINFKNEFIPILLNEYNLNNLSDDEYLIYNSFAGDNGFFNLKKKD